LLGTWAEAAMERWKKTLWSECVSQKFMYGKLNPQIYM
jgi:hypothetical protein